MKKNVTNNKLAFNKAVVTELNENQLLEINGGGITSQFQNGFEIGVGIVIVITVITHIV